MRKLWLSLVLLLTMTVAVQAQDDKAYETAMRKMLEVSKSMDAMKQMAPQITAMLQQQATAEIPQEFWDEMEKEMIKMFDRVVKAMLPIYQKYLTLEDINGIIQFYETPVGKKLAETNTKIAMEVMPVAQQVGMQTMQELSAKMREKGYIK